MITTYNHGFSEIALLLIILEMD